MAVQILKQALYQVSAFHSNEVGKCLEKNRRLDEISFHICNEKILEQICKCPTTAELISKLLEKQTNNKNIWQGTTIIFSTKQMHLILFRNSFQLGCNWCYSTEWYQTQFSTCYTWRFTNADCLSEAHYFFKKQNKTKKRIPLSLRGTVMSSVK